MIINEIKKILESKALWFFLVFCLAVNTFVVFVNYKDVEVTGLGEFTAREGHIINEEFIEKLDNDEKVYKGEEFVYAKRDMLNLLNGTKEYYRDFDVKENLLNPYLDMLGDNSIGASLQKAKYKQVEERVGHLAEIKADMNLYAGKHTIYLHQNTASLVITFAGEVAIIAIMVTSYILGYEKSYKTDQYIYASKKGRKINIYKIIAAAIVVLALYALLAIITIGLVHFRWDYRGIWDSNVSSQFNLVNTRFMDYPLITWTDMTVKEYFLACTGLVGAFAIVSVLFTAILGILIPNSYAAGLAVLVASFLGYAIGEYSMNSGAYNLYYLSSLQPVNIWMNMKLWFSEGGINFPSAWWEIKGLVIFFVIYLIILFFVIRRSYRKDVY